MHFVRPDFEIDAIQSMNTAEAFADAAHGEQWSTNVHGSATGFSSTPMPLASRRTISPALRKTWGLRKTPTPAGVPVLTMSPGSRVMMLDKKPRSLGSGNTQSAVEPF